MTQILLGTALLLVVLALFTLFSYKAPQGMKAMGALANAACASFLVEAFHFSLFGEQMGIKFLEGVGSANGNLGGVAAGILVPLALGVSPVYAVLVGLTVSGFGILPGFIAGYLVSFVIKFLEEKVPAGLDLIAIILVAAPLARFIAMAMDPVVKNTLLQIGQVLIQAFFSKMKFGSKKDTIAVAIEPLTQSDIISANPIPVYVTNFIGGAMSGIIVALMGIQVGTPGLATPIAGFFVSVAQNGTNALIAAVGCVVVSVLAGFIGHAIFKNTKIKTADEIRGTQSFDSNTAA